jgi:outer membrane receptor protein involved in Fe transport
LDAHLTDRIELSMGGSSANAHLVGPQPASSGLYEGETLGGVPKWTANASALYKMPISDQFALSGRIDYTYQSSRPSVTPTQSPAYFVVGPSNLTSLHLLLEQHDRWTLGLHVTNLFNKFEPLSAQALDSNLIKTITAAPPRTATLTVTTQF